jgi:hypothetical protein
MQQYKIVYKGRKEAEEFLLPDDGLFKLFAKSLAPGAEPPKVFIYESPDGQFKIAVNPAEVMTMYVGPHKEKQVEEKLTKKRPEKGTEA